MNPHGEIYFHIYYSVMSLVMLGVDDLTTASAFASSILMRCCLYVSYIV